MFLNKLFVAFGLIICISLKNEMIKGEDASPDQFPFLALIFSDNYSLRFKACGVIVSERLVLTNANQWYLSSPLVVCPASVYFFEIEKTYDRKNGLRPGYYFVYGEKLLHPRSEYESNLALLKTLKPIDFSGSVNKIRLPIEEYPDEIGLSGVVLDVGKVITIEKK